jgi:hypothetical protein
MYATYITDSCENDEVKALIPCVQVNIIKKELMYFYNSIGSNNDLYYINIGSDSGLYYITVGTDNGLYC